MSHFDVSHIASSLQSARLKERNDALNLLETSSAAQTALNAKQFAILSAALFKLVETEKNIYAQNKNPLVETRLSKAANCLRSLLQKYIANHSLVAIKYKNCLFVISNIIDAYFVESELVVPTAFDFLSTLSLLLSQAFVREHLSSDAWLKIYAFLLRLINHILERFQTAVYDSLLTELFTALLNLLDAHSPVNYLPILSEGAYVQLLGPLTLTLEVFKKESLLVVNVFKIINKLLVMFSTENSLFLNRLIRLGVTAFIQFHLSKFDSLQAEFLVFLNIDITHDYLNIDQLPQLNGEKSDLFEDDPDISIRSNNEIPDPIEADLYNLGVLVQILLSKLNSVENQLSPSEVGFDLYGTEKSWFELRSICLTSENTRPWLLCSGLAKLAKTFYFLKAHTSEKNDARALHSILTLSNPQPSMKRQKLGVVGDSLNFAASLPEFCLRLMGERNDPKFQVMGLILLAFHLESSQMSVSAEISECQAASEDLTMEETSVMNTTIDDQNGSVLAVDRIFQSILNLPEGSEVDFWRLVTCHTLVSYSGVNMRSRDLSRLLKMCLASVKNRELANISCLLTYQICFYYNGDAHTLIDPSLVVQIESLIDLAEIYGPYSLSQEAFCLWYAVNEVARIANLSRQKILTQRIFEWMHLKWDVAALCSIPSKAFCSFIVWLGGEIPSSPSLRTDVYRGSLNQSFILLNERKVLLMFIRLKDSPKECPPRKVRISPIQENTDCMEKLLGKALESANVANRTAEIRYSWAIRLLEMASLLETKQVLLHLLSTLEYRATVLLESLEVLATSLQSNHLLISRIIATETLLLGPRFGNILKKTLPFDHLIGSFLNRGRNHIELFDNALDNEFGKSKVAKEAPSNRIVLAHESVNCVEAIKLLIWRENLSDEALSFSTILSFLQSLGPADTLYCFYFVAEHLHLHNAITSPLIMTKLVRILGEKCLTDHELERSEITFIVVSRLLRVIYTKYVHLEEASTLADDSQDLCSWLLQCGNKNLITTEAAFIEYALFLLELLNVQNRHFDTKDTRALFLGKFQEATNHSKVVLAAKIVSLMQTCSGAEQVRMYKDLFHKFETPQQSLETGATFCLFFSVMSQCSTQIMVSCVYNLLEYSRFSFFRPYLARALEEICRLLGLQNAQALFRAFLVEILKCWLTFGLEIHLFPFDLFGYASLSLFLGDNFKELTAIVISTKVGGSKMALLERLAKIKQVDVKSLTSDSISLAIPLAYTEGGVRNEIHKILTELLKDQLKPQLKEKLLISVYQLIRYTDVSDETRISQIVKGSENLFGSSSIIGTPGLVTITLESSMELLNALIKRRYLNTADFWLARNTYFLIRRLLLLLDTEVTSDQRLVCLRKIKLVFALEKGRKYGLNLTRLVVNMVTPLMGENAFICDIGSLLEHLQIDKLHDVLGVNQSLPLVIQLLSLAARFASFRSTKVIGLLENYVSKLNPTEAPFHVLRSSLRVELSPLKASYIEEFLLHGNQTSMHEGHLLSLLSLVFEHTEVILDSSKTNENIVRMLIASGDYSKQFMRWSAGYLSRYYLDGGLTHGSGILRPQGENQSVSVEEFNKSTTKLNPIVELIGGYLLSENAKVAACAESIMGVLLWKFDLNRTDVLKFVDFGESYETYSDFIVPLDFHSCVLLNSSDDESVFVGDSLGSMIINMEVSIIENNFDIWTAKLFLAIVQELARYTSIATLFSGFVAKVPSFAKQALPSFICYFISLVGEAAANQIASLFEEFLRLETPSNEAVDLFTRVILFIRVGAKQKLPLFRGIYEGIDLTKFYTVACRNKLHKTSLLLLEDAYSNEPESKGWLNDTELLASIYESIDDPDLIYGLPEETSLSYAISVIRRGYDTSQEVKLSSGLLDARVSLGQNTTGSPLIRSMMRDGLMGVARSASVGDLGDHNDNYEWAWKLQKWDIPVQSESVREHELIYRTLKHIHDAPMDANRALESSVLDIFTMKNQLLSESSTSRDYAVNLSRWLKTVAAICSIDEVVSLDMESFSQPFGDYVSRTRWFEAADMDLCENIVLARKAAFQLLSESSLSSKVQRENSWLCVVSELVRYNGLSRINGKVQKTISSAILLDEIAKSKFQESPIQQGVAHVVAFLAAQSLWAQGQTGVPVAMLKNLQLPEKAGFPLTSLNVDPCLIKATLAVWMTESRHDLGTSIMEKYVDPILNLVQDMDEISQRARVYHLLANFCETQYKSHNLNEQIKKLKKRVENKQVEIDELKAHYGKNNVSADEKKAAQKYYSKVKSLFNAELAELKALLKSKDDFSDRCIEFYLKSTLSDSETGENLDKLFALFLEHSNKHELYERLHKDIVSIPSYKLIGWSTQLVSRLASESSPFQTRLQQLILQVCYDHPYHTLYNLVSLKKHEDFADESSSTDMKLKVAAAGKIYTRLSRMFSNAGREELRLMESLCDECVHLARYKAPKGRSISLEKMPLGDYWLNSLPRIPPPTFEVRVSNTGYQNAVFMEKIDPKITIATSGLSLPKIANLQLSDGSVHSMLFKSGTDDMRQDLIMEQVFEKVNNIFRKDRETRKRELRVRTYKAIPLGPQSGVIEFVPNLKALIDVVKPYHQAHDKIKAEKAREAMKNAQTLEKPERVAVYQRLSEKIRPVLRHFFFDSFLTPEDWLDSRILYTHGIATTSMVGHILGLGDRHCNNILLDKNTGEPIHIDLGVAFDQGKRLPIPETVPFRLTRDIVDGFGVTGTAGSFSRSCEHTLRVLRSNRDHILAILDVLRWDPLYLWTILPIRKKRLQDDTTERQQLQPQEEGLEAGRAVLMVSEKLTAEGLSVEAAVRELIQDATSIENLALIYCGWCPFF